MMKNFYCTPIGRVIPIIFIICILIWIYLMMHLRQEVFILFAIINILLDLIMIVYTAKTVVRRVELYSDKIVCKGLLPSQTYEIEFEKCNIGMDTVGEVVGKFGGFIYVMVHHQDSNL